eukprot:2804599-Amphidinium_carterae.1
MVRISLDNPHGFFDCELRVVEHSHVGRNHAQLRVSVRLSQLVKQRSPPAYVSSKVCKLQLGPDMPEVELEVQAAAVESQS